MVVALAVAKNVEVLGGKLYRTENGNETKTRKERKEENEEEKMKMSQRVLCCLNEAEAGKL